MQSPMNADLLKVSDLFVAFPTNEGKVKALNGVDLSIAKEEVFGLIGESGCGKSVLGLAIVRLLQEDVHLRGNIHFKGRSLHSLGAKDMARLRGKEIGMILQNPSTSLNPVLKIGHQIAEPLMLHKGHNAKSAHSIVLSLLNRVKIREPHRQVSAYPHQFSGGMKERAIIAMGIASEPEFIIADEPTKGLDVTVKRNIVKILKDVSAKKTMLIITHDLAVAEEVCNKIAVMYAGELLEIAPVSSLFESQLHPYTQGLFNSLPSRGLNPIHGSSPSLIDLPQGCRFHPRCTHCQDKCKTEHPPMFTHNGRQVRCFMYA